MIKDTVGERRRVVVMLQEKSRNGRMDVINGLKGNSWI